MKILITKVFLLIILISANLFSQAQKGKITGRVVDDQTNEPLIGANVIIEGTSLGATCDVNGRFIILNVFPGKYNLTASLVGYAKTTKTSVEVFIDRTTEVNFRLKDQSVQVQTVVVVAEKPKIIKDQTSSSNTIDDEQIKVAPIEGMKGALELTSSFQKDAQGNYAVRGSGNYEVNFQINGVEQITSNTSIPGMFASSKANNSWKYDVNPLGVQQLQMITGGFSAEYGNAQAGVVKVVMKEGSPKFSGEVRVEYRPPGQYHFDKYLYDHSNYEWQKWGKLENWMAQRNLIISELNLDKDFRYGALYNQSKTDSNALKLWNQIVDQEIEWAWRQWMKDHSPSDDNPFGIYDYRKEAYTRYLIGFGGPLGKDPNLLKFFLSGEYRKNPTRLPSPERNQIYQNYVLNLTYQPFAGHKFIFMGSFQKYRGGINSGSDDIRYSGVSGGTTSNTKYLITVDPVRTEQTIAQSLNWNYAIDANSVLEATIAHQQEIYQLPYEYLINITDSERERLDSLYDPRGIGLRTGVWSEQSYFRQPFNISTNYYQDSRTNHWSLKVDYSNQLLKTNLFKAGVRAYYWDLFNNGVNSAFQANAYLTRSGYAEYYHAYPYSLSAYVQDKMEYEGMIANVGLRAEAFNFQRNVPVDKFNVFYPGTSGPGIGNPETEPSKTQFILLPRIGVSFPIGEATAFRFQYGHFASMPIFSQGLSQQTNAGWTGLGNPNLDYKKTISYEFGIQQVLGEDHRLDFVLFYNDRKNQIGTIYMASYTGSANRLAGFSKDNKLLFDYTTYMNNAFGSTIGLEVIFEKFTVGNWSYRLSYTLSMTTEGNYGSRRLFPDGKGFETRDFTTEYISYSDRTHNFRGLLQYRIGEQKGINIFGFYPFENTIVSLTYTAQSGLPFTYRDTYAAKDAINNKRYPLESSADLNFVKSFKLIGLNFIFGVRVMNLLNNKWLTPMSNATDIQNWIENGITIADPGNDPLRPSYLITPYMAYRNIPRQVFITLGVGF